MVLWEGSLKHPNYLKELAKFVDCGNYKVLGFPGARGCLRNSGAGRNRIQILSGLTLCSNCSLGYVGKQQIQWNYLKNPVPPQSYPLRYVLSDLISLVFCKSFLVYRFLKL